MNYLNCDKTQISLLGAYLRVIGALGDAGFSSQKKLLKKN